MGTRRRARHRLRLRSDAAALGDKPGTAPSGGKRRYVHRPAVGKQQSQSERMGKMKARGSEDGFTIIEVLIAALVFSLSSLAVFGAVRQLAANAASAEATTRDDGTIDHLVASLTSDSSTA